jgi:hypothetical protein
LAPLRHSGFSLDRSPPCLPLPVIFERLCRVGPRLNGARGYALASRNGEDGAEPYCEASARH